MYEDLTSAEELDNAKRELRFFKSTFKVLFGAAILGAIMIIVSFVLFAVFGGFELIGSGLKGTIIAFGHAGGLAVCASIIIIFLVERKRIK